jgi:ribosomal protein S18 acetylase RimI-like enzyme
MEQVTHGEASCMISPFEQKGVKDSLAFKIRVLSHLYVAPEHRKQGHASKLLNKIGREADEAQIALILEPNSYDDGEMTKEQLVAFYRQHGFIELQKEPAHLLVRIPVPPTLYATVKKTRGLIEDVYGNSYN